jgi:hypothetical protein
VNKDLIRAAAALALLAGGGAASAKTDPAAWVGRIVVELDEINRRQAWAPEGDPRPGSLASGAEARLDYALAAATQYRLVVICEPMCGAGEVEWLDPSGTRVGEPGNLVNMPALPIAPTASGTYSLRIAMTECAERSCAWSARLYHKAVARRRK